MRTVEQEASRPLVIVVDDDLSVRIVLEELLQSVEIDAVGYSSAREVTDAMLADRPGCLILDVRMPGLSGLEFQQKLVAKGITKPIIFLSGYGDVQMAAQAMKAGAVDFFTKPVRHQTLLDAVGTGISRDLAQRAQTSVVKQHIDRLETITPREREVLREVARGRLNKQIAFDLGISPVTVKLHRSNVMRKMKAGSIGELIRAWGALPAEIREGLGRTQSHKM